MTDEGHHQRLKDAFAEALGKDARGRAALLRELGETDPRVAEDVRELLRHHDPDDSFLESSVLESLADDTPAAEALVGQRLGRFTIVRLIAAGAMGAVYEAEQDEPRRAVAVKVLRAGAMSPRSLRRFRYEAEILGRLRHPGIAQIYEAGTHADGALTAPYFAMELVPDARDVTRYAREEHLTQRETLELFSTVCRAVHHGHQKGVIHRDLKPANILVGSAGRPKVIDFGVARAVDPEVSATAGTVAGQFVGTLQYMSPEQLRPKSTDIDTRTDVYALGVVLYELVCGRPPHDLTGLSFIEAADLLRRERVPLAGAAERSARGDLEAIIAKATEAERGRRYQSAEALDEDIARFLRSEPVLASRPGIWRQLRLFARRRMGSVVAASAVLAALVLATVVSVWFAVRADRARSAEELARINAQQSTQRATRVVSLLNDMIAVGESGSGAGLTGMLEETAARLDAGLEEDPLVEASIRLTIGQAYFGLGRYAQAETQLRRSLSLREAHAGPSATETLEAAGALSLALVERGRLAEASTMAERTAAALGDDREADPARLSASLMTRAALARRTGLPADADRLYARAQGVLTPGEPAWVSVSLERAEIALELGAPRRAITSLTPLSRFNAQTSDVNSRRTGRLLAVVLRQLGNPDRALARLSVLIARDTQDLGPMHPETLRAQLEYEMMRAAQGKPGPAGGALALLIEQASAALGNDRPVVAQLRAARARCLEMEGRGTEAVEVWRRRVAGLASIDGVDRPGVAEAVLDVVDALLTSGNAEQAEALASEIHRTCETVFPPGSVVRARAEMLFHEASVRVGRTQGDEAALLAAVRAFEAQLGPDHPLTRRARALAGAPPPVQ